MNNVIEDKDDTSLNANDNRQQTRGKPSAGIGLSSSESTSWYSSETGWMKQKQSYSRKEDKQKLPIDEKVTLFKWTLLIQKTVNQRSQHIQRNLANCITTG